MLTFFNFSGPAAVFQEKTFLEKTFLELQLRTFQREDF
jgi:hypothetical protein